MEKILQTVLENYPKFIINKQAPPSYVEMYTKSKENVVIVHSKPKQTQANSDIIKSDKNKLEELDLTGSPLKLDLSLHTLLDDTFINDEPQLWREEEALHAPIETEAARELLNFYNQTISTMKAEDSIPMWVLSQPTDKTKTLLLTVQSNENQFGRGAVTYEGSMSLDEVDVEDLIQKFAALEGRHESSVQVSVECKYPIFGSSYRGLSSDDMLRAARSGDTQLYCQWNNKTLSTPFMSCNVHLEQEVTVGHPASPCNAMWKSVRALHNINRLLVEMTAAGAGCVPLDAAAIGDVSASASRPDNSRRLTELLMETESLSFAPPPDAPGGGGAGVRPDTRSLGHCLAVLAARGSSDDFTYKLWDILRDCDSAEELITLLIRALKFISSGKIRPFIDVNNNTYLSKLVLKLSRGHSQSSKVLKNLRASPPQALSVVGQVGVQKTSWEYTRVMSLLEHSFFVAGIWNTDARSHESIDQINQTIQDMTMGGDTLNPFDTLTTTEHSIRMDAESICIDDGNELTVDDFASLKKHGLVNERKDVNEVPLIADEIDISPWKNLLMKFAQVHVCLEHLYRAETCLRANFAQLKPMASKLLDYYVSERSPIKTVGQLIAEATYKICIPITNNVVQDHLKKPAAWYRVNLSFKESNNVRSYKMTSVFSQLSVFPPQVWQYIDPPTEEVADVTTVEEIKYHCTKYIYVRDKYSRKLDFLS